MASPSLPHAPPPGRAPLGWLALAALAAACVALGRLLPAYFVGDDFAFVGRYAAFPFAEWPGLFARNWQQGLFAVDLREIRPLTALAFMLDARLWGAEPLGFRLTNLVLHAACAGLVGWLAWEISRRRRVALLAALLFAFHPVAVPAAGWITGRVDALSTLFVLGAALSWLRARTTTPAPGPIVLVAACFAAALFTKEAALVFPALALLLDSTATSPARAPAWPRYGALLAVLAVYGACRYAAFGVAGPEGVGRGFAAFAGEGFGRELLARQGRYVAHLFWPAAEWLAQWRDETGPPTGAALARIAGLAAFGAALALAGWRWWRRATAERRWRLPGFALGWYLLTTVPLLFTYFSARHLYLTMAGLAVPVAIAGGELLPTRRRFLLGATAVVLLVAVGQQVLVSRWRRAADRSLALARAVQSTAHDAAPGTVVFIDAPELVDGAFCWSWAVPHALRPPFTPMPIDSRLAIVVRPAAYAQRERWRAHLPTATLAAASRAAAFLVSNSDGTVSIRSVSAERVRHAAERIRAAPQDLDDELWARLHDELLAPREP